MRKRTHFNWTMVCNPFRSITRHSFMTAACIAGLGVSEISSQCNVLPGEISGKVFLDNNQNGTKDPSESGVPQVLIRAVDANGGVAAQTLSAVDGTYTIPGLSNQSIYRLEMVKPSQLNYGVMGVSGASDIKFISAPACNIYFGLQDLQVPCTPEAAKVFTTCFVKSGGSDQAPTLVQLPFNFNTGTMPAKLAMQNQTGSVWGLAWNKARQELYSSAFVKYGAALGSGGSGGIYVTQPATQNTQLFVNLDLFGVHTGPVNGMDPLDCNYSDWVGKAGLGDMDISDDDRYLFVSNLYNRSLVIIPTDHPSSSSVYEIKIPDPGCNKGDYVVGAVEYHNGLVYIGVTCTAESSKDNNDSYFHIYEFNLLSRTFNLIFSSGFAKEYWLSKPANQRPVSQWLSNIAFVNDNFMVLGIADRTGHTYCDEVYPLTGEYGDIVMLYKEGNNWLLESGSVAGSRTGSGLHHYEGPGGGEFFGEDYWTVGPGLHPEVSFGAVTILKDYEQVISTCFDPVYESFSGGLHKYNTLNGKKISSIQLYNKSNSSYGKSAGLGDLAIGCQNIPIEIGNFVWMDDNKNGIQDANEAVLKGLKISLLDAGCNEIATTTTDNYGYYRFNGLNVDANRDGVFDGLQSFEDYYIVVSDSRFNPLTGKMIIGSDTTSLTIHQQTNGVELVNSDAEFWLNAPCTEFLNFPVVAVHTGGSGQNDYSFDIGFVKQKTIVVPPPPPPVKVYDLALIKRVNASQPVKNGDVVAYTIFVYNQGTQAVAHFEITDYVSNYFQFDPALNPSWSLVNGKAKFQSSKSILPGEVFQTEIFLKLNSTLRPNEILNAAEISSMRDDLGASISDTDSTPDDIENNDKGGVPNSETDNLITNNSIDEDDHDRESLPIADLALLNIALNNAPVKKNETVTFEMQVFNQGNIAVGSFDLVNYIPAGLLFDAAANPGWSVSGNKAYRTINTLIQPGQTASFTIQLRLNSSAKDKLIDVAEIYGMRDANGVALKDFDSTPDNNPSNDTGGQLYTATDNQVNDNGLIDEDDADPATVTIHDLALILTTDKNLPVQSGEDVTFHMTVCNQGSLSAKDIGIVYYLPSGLSVSPLDNHGWFLLGGLLRNSMASEIAPGACSTLDLVLRVKSDARPDGLLSIAEITGARDLAGQSLTDRDYDSQADLNPGNDAGGVVGSATDNIFNGDGLLDEDDADPAALSMLDLALTKEYTNATSLKYGGKAGFRITVYNQGNVNLKSIGIVDYLPDGLALSQESVQAGWTQTGKQLHYLMQGMILPANAKSVSLVLDQVGSIDPALLTNRAEIQSIIREDGTNVSSYDFDSTPDEDQNNDTGGVPNSPTDNVIDEQRIVDEDDADPAGVPVFDLALVKKLVETKLAYRKGDTVEYTIEVINQGNVIAKNIELVDYVHTDYIFSQALNAGWSAMVDNKVHYALPGTLEPGQSTTVTIRLIFASLKKGEYIPNYAEISKATDNVGKPANDYDSTFDDISNNDKGGVPGTTEDNRTDDHGLVDEDDHDGADSNPVNFDLALIKDVDQTIVSRDQLLTFHLRIYNQGLLSATEMELVDYIPDGLLLEDPDWEVRSSSNGITRAYYLMNVQNGRLPDGGLKSGDSLVVPIKLRVDPNQPAGVIVNRAEIYRAVNAGGLTDDDSNPDDDFLNDPGGVVFNDSDGSSANPDPLTSPDDEDDSDPAGIIVVDLERSVACYCLNNAYNGDDGQFFEELTFRSVAGDTWFIYQVDGLYHELSMSPPNIPLDFVTGPAGYVLAENNLGDGTSIYTMHGIHIDGKGYSLILSNQNGVKLSTGVHTCHYNQPVLLKSQNNVCAGQTFRYQIKAIPNAIYKWTLSSGGSIISNPNDHTVDVEWTGAIGTTHILKIELDNTDSCYSPILIPVTIGATSGPVSCIGSVQVSLSTDCEVKVTPQMLLLGGPYDYTSYAVMIFNKDGSLVPNNILRYIHLGQTLVAKVINVCNGNSCWSNILVEDKIKPTITCLNDTIDCTLMKSYLHPFIQDNCDATPQAILVDETIENTPCNDLYSKIVTRTYKAKDQSGNLSAACTMNVFLKRIQFDSLDFPDSLDRFHNNPLICGHFPADSLGRPLPSCSGVPYYRGLPAWPNKDNLYCDYVASYEDLEWRSADNCVRKILRNWKFTTWYCTSFKQRNYQQLIEIVDTSAPVIACPYDFTASSNGYTCEANVWIAMPKAYDSCGSVSRIDLSYPGGFIKNYAARYITLPVGIDTLTFTAYDVCYNHSSCTFTVTVEDQAPPVAVCDRETVVTLDRFGEVWVPATVFDDGSYDDCHIKSMQVRRMSAQQVCGRDETTYRDSIHFCCEDLGNEVMVMFRVTDAHGNENTCMVRVEVQDKTIPHIDCPHDVTITCHEHIDTSDLSRFGIPRVSDNCNTTYYEQVVVNIDQCREGYIDRVFTAGNGNGIDVCVQRIWIINPEPFKEEDITWPLDYETNGCLSDDLLPEKLPTQYGFPVLKEDFCDLVGVSFEDHTFRFINGGDACYKIIRKWKVANWCRFRDPVTNEPIYFTHDQILKVHNYDDPVILTGCRDTVFNIIDTTCFGGDAYLVATAHDLCTPDNELAWEYHIDLNRDGIYDYSDLGVGNEIKASGYYPLGKHRVKYVFEDRCGNKSVCERNFEIVNCKPPTAYCKVGLSTSLVPMDLNGNGSVDAELATIWAKDFDNGSYHICGYPLTFSFGKDTSVKSIVYDCDSIGRRTVTLCVTASNGKQDCCNSYIDIQDNNNVSLCGCVTFPPNVTITDCSQNVDPVVIDSKPSIGNCTGCVHKSTTYKDSISTKEPNTCFVVYRTWKVVFDCVGEPGRTFDRTQRIVVTTDLKESDIVWPKDSVIVDNCRGAIDTATVGEVPRYCVHGGSVLLMYTDKEIRREQNCIFYERNWRVYSTCVPSQSYTFRQVLKVIEGAGIRYILPPDITVTGCKDPIDPGLLNGFPKTNCPCDKFQHSFKDSVVTTEPNTCYVIYRKWTSTFNCPPDVSGTYKGTQKITVRVKLELKDISWPKDTVFVDNCKGSVDTADIDNVPRLNKDFCGYVKISYSDQTLSQNDTCKWIRRTWLVYNDCSDSPFLEQFSFLQYLKVTKPNGPKLKVPDDITVTDCHKPLLPDSLNGYPKLNCPCNVFTHTYQDSIVTTEPNTCYVIYRKWTSTFNCPPDVSGTFKGTQKITIRINLNPNDILWPKDTVIVTNCPGSVDTAVIDNVPRLKVDYCGYVSFTFADVTLSKNDTCKYIRRTWTANNNCTSGANKQQFNFIQILKVTNPDKPRVTIPSDLTVTDCKKPFLPDSLNGYPKALCTCDSIKVSYKDDTVFTNPEVCYVVERNWAIRFKCKPNYDSTFHYIQKITRDVDLNPADIMWPQSMFTSYTCTPTLDPKIVGEPKLTKDYCGFVTFIYVDAPLSTSKCTGIVRTWTAVNSCSQSQRPQFVQTIEIKNQKAPNIKCPKDTVVNADPNTCGKVLQLGNPSLEDDCNTGVTFTNNAPPVYPVGMTFVVFTAKDTCGHTSTCTTKVTVIENVPPEIVCPVDLTISCGVDTKDLTQFGNAVATDNCPGVTVVETSVRLQDVCGIGTIIRKFVAVDASGNRDSCTQTITIQNLDPLDDVDIIWPPSPVTVGECESYDPSVTGSPAFDSTGISCLKAMITYADSNLCEMNMGCDIERTWTVYDTCSDRTFSFVQTIHIDDTNPPNILGVSDTTVYSTDTSCNNYITLKAFVDNCDSANIIITNDSPYGANQFEDASGYYPPGMTMVTFTARDGCCNVSMKTVKINVIDTVAPDFTCRKVVKKIKDDGCAVFNAKDFILKIEDNCTDSAFIKASFDPNDFNDTLFVICCDSITNYEYTAAVKVYFMDQAGNMDSCSTFLQAVDQDTICGPTFRSHVKGFVRSRKAFTMPGVNVMLNAGASGIDITRSDGFYGFLNMPNGGDYDVSAEHDVNPLNGVTTADIIHIQRHILGISPFTDPLKFIAADVNGNARITAADIVEIRKLILGQTSRFAKSPSWRFLLSNYVFKDKDDPLSDDYPTYYHIDKIHQNYYIDFTGVKMGDVDDSNDPTDLGHSVQDRSSKPALVIVKDFETKLNQEYDVELDVAQFEVMDGLQISIAFNPALAVLESADASGASFVSDDILYLDKQQNRIRISYARGNELNRSGKIKLRFRATANSRVSDCMQLESMASFVSEAYFENGSTSPLRIEFMDEQENASGISLYQNIPNPFRQMTIIPFSCTEDAEIEFNVIDMNGRIVYTQKQNYAKGYHEIEIRKSQLGNEGIFYYQLKTNNTSLFRRMILID